MKWVVPALILPALVPAQGAEAVQEFRLPNGLRVILVENHERPLVRLDLRIPWDVAEEPRGKEGIGGFLAAVLKAGGSGTLSREAFLRFLEDRSLRFSFGIQSGGFSWSVLSDSQGQDGAFDSLNMAAAHPSFDEPCVEAERQRLVQLFKRQTSRDRARERFLRGLRGSSVLTQPTQESLGRIEAQDLRDVLRRCFRPERAVLVVQGDLNLVQARQLAVLHLGAWGPAAAPPAHPADAPDPAKSPEVRTLVTSESASTVEVWAGAPPQGLDLRQQAALELVRWLLMRDLAPDPLPPLGSLDFQMDQDGSWTLKAIAPGDGSAAGSMQAIQDLLAGFRGRHFSAGDLAAARSSWRREYASRTLHPKLESAALAQRALEGGDPGALLDTLSPADLDAVARRVLDPQGCRYLALGVVPDDVARLVKAGLGPVAVVD